MDDFNPFRTVGIVMGVWMAIIATLGVGSMVAVFYLINKLIEKL